MQHRTHELTFSSVTARDQTFVTTLARRAFARWSNDPANNVLGMVHNPRAIAELGIERGKKVGLFVVSITSLGRPYGPFEDPRLAHLDAIAVTPGMTGRGIGGILLERAELIARQRGAVVMTLLTAVGNGPGQRLFASRGFMPVLRSRSRYVNDEDGIEMFKALGPS